VKIGSAYLLGAGLLICAAAAAWPWGVVLLWPALSVAIASGAYFGRRASVFHKSHGRISVPTRVLLLPYLAGQRVSWMYYRRQTRLYGRVAPGVLVGAMPSGREAEHLVEQGVTAVLDLTAELSEARPFTEVAYKNIPVVDLTPPTVRELMEGAVFIAEHATRGVVYVHCKIGYARSAAMVAAYLLYSGRARTVADAFDIVRRARPSIVVRPEVWAVLWQFERALVSGVIPPDVNRTLATFIVSTVLFGAARLVTGTAPKWAGCEPSVRPRIYFANHTSHLDFLVIWASLPAEARALTRPVAGRDYWERTRLRRYLARHVFNAVLIDRHDAAAAPTRHARVLAARQSVELTAEALTAGASVVVFPEGTRGDGTEVAPFKSGLYHLCRLCPDAEVVPVHLEHFHRIMPKGAWLPVPINGAVTFGEPIRLEPREDKTAFLARARGVLASGCRPCTPSTRISRAS
jgi:1-acyl-sn-glycerol-3-phosphate acyltransferase